MSAKSTFLDELWEMLDSFNVSASKEEKEIISRSADCESKLVKSLTEEQKELFLSFTNTMSDLNYLERKEAFIKGIKFATCF